MAGDRLPHPLSERQTRRRLNLFPPWLVQGIRIVELGPGFQRCRVRVARSRLTRNLQGTIFGGTIFAAADPVYAILYWQILAHRGVRVQAWLRSASIRYLRPARSALTLDFALSDGDVAAAVAALERDGRFSRTHRVLALDAAGKTCAEADTDVVLERA
ncbi:MAG TPA: DUF4442 domain-containing protein [Candidatus Polarisedimenticolaceae bacterium]|nr:DUF4442 domain-containing protein [Candidatus Polarisedimenticolaceae bacterium]